jgi:hypothetical protein
MRQFLVRLRHTVAILTAIAVFASSTEAFAGSGPGQPGEDSSYSEENIAGFPDFFRQLQTTASYDEARNNGVLIRVWRAASSDQSVWMAYGIGDGPFQIGGPTETEFAPVVVPYGLESFMIFHVGIDHRIYFNILNPADNSNTGWQAIPNQSTNSPVSAVQFSQNSVQLVYKGDNSDENVYGTWFDGNSWHFEGSIAGGQVFSAPSVTFNKETDQLIVVGRGLDQAVWYSTQTIGQLNWNPWRSLGQQTINSPQIIAAPDGNLVISYISPAQVPMYSTFDPNFNQMTNWTADTSGFLSFNPVRLVLVGAQVWALLTSLGGVGWNKHLTTP